jgi:hypothetical protein
MVVMAVLVVIVVIIFNIALLFKGLNLIVLGHWQ